MIDLETILLESGLFYKNGGVWFSGVEGDSDVTDEVSTIIYKANIK